MEFFSRKIRSLNTYQKNNAQGEGKKKNNKKNAFKVVSRNANNNTLPQGPQI